MFKNIFSKIGGKDKTFSLIKAVFAGICFWHADDADNTDFLHSPILCHFYFLITFAAVNFGNACR